MWNSNQILFLYLLAQNKCGLVPSKIFLPKGEKRQLVFWTDQDYTQVTTVSSVTSSSPTSQEPVDDFLEAVNGNKPSLSDFLIETEAELENKVTWPTRDETTRNSLVVCVTAAHDVGIINSKTKLKKVFGANLPSNTIKLDLPPIQLGLRVCQKDSSIT